MDGAKITAVYFSPTGGTGKVALILAGAMGSEVRELDITDYEAGRLPVEFSAGEVVVFAVPVYGGRVPAEAAKKIGRMTGNGAHAVLAAVYGNRACDDALLELKEIVMSHGFTPAAAVMAVAEHSVMRRFASGRPDRDDVRELARMGEEIAGYLSGLPIGSAIPELTVPGTVPYREYNGIPFKPKAGKECVRCGQCAAHCPVHAIPSAHPEKTDTDLCISCMRCIAVCPGHARSLNRMKLAVAGKAMESQFCTRKENVLILPS